MEIANITVDKNLLGEATLTLDFNEDRHVQVMFKSGEPSSVISAKLRSLADEIDIMDALTQHKAIQKENNHVRNSLQKIS